MSGKPDLVPIEMNSSKVLTQVLTNIVIMLTNRGILKKNKLDSNIKSLLETSSDINEYVLTIDNPDKYYNKDVSKFFIKILKQKITGVSKSSTIGDFLHKYKNAPKIIIVETITKKAHEQALTEFPNTEIFYESTLMIDIYSFVSVPVHELLSPEETVQVLEEYKAKKKEMPKILSTDAMAKYFNAPVDSLFRIIRASETSGETIYYRRVVMGHID